MLDGEPFSLKVVAAMINPAGFKKIRIFDPHSEVSTALIDRSYAVSNHGFVADALSDYACTHSGEAPVLVSPDAGALKKIHKLAQHLGIENIFNKFIFLNRKQRNRSLMGIFGIFLVNNFIKKNLGPANLIGRFTGIKDRL